MITVANANALHIPLADQTVQCVITSPPYWGLRDYGTAKWEGGSAECDHVANANATKKFGNPEFNENRPSRDETKTAGYYRDICPRCGARRIDAQIGLEATPAEYVAHIVAVMREVWRVLRYDGVLWLNLGDSYFGDSPTRRSSAEAFSEIWDKSQTRSRGGLRRSAASVDGLKPKDLCGIPWRVAFALQGFALISIDEIAALCRAIDARDIPALDFFRAGFRLWEELSGMGWFYNRIDVIWHKPNPMPESVTDRPTKAHEYVFLLTKQPRYYYDAEAIKETGSIESAKRLERGVSDNHKNINGAPGQPPHSMNQPRPNTRSGNGEYEAGTRNRRSVWTVATSPYSGAHFATFPPALVEPMILAGSRRGDVVLDPFAGSGTTGAVAVKHGRRAVLLDLNTKYIDLQFERTNGVQMVMSV